ncbi:MAG: hypothetical protein H6636_12590 [Anaerolineales bacterium]|nr:hypothetical protein [Anaerolineales bacterium]
MLVCCLIVPVGLALAHPSAETIVGGSIISDTTWTAEHSPYIVTANINVVEGITLIIDPGVTVRFNAGYKLQVNGQLIVQGTGESPVRFTSNQADPQPGDWDKIELIPTITDENGVYISGSLLTGCVVEYAGEPGSLPRAFICAAYS